MFDVYGLVGELAVKYAAGKPFRLPDCVMVSSEPGFSGYYQDTVDVAGQPVTLAYHVTSIQVLNGDALEMRPDSFAKTWMQRAISELNYKFHEVAGGRDLVAVRTPPFPGPKGPISGGGVLDFGPVKFRWMIDYDASWLANRLVMDTFIGVKNLGDKAIA